MNNERAKELINNLLYHIWNYTEISEGGVENFINWLKIEVGFTNDELKELYFIKEFEIQNQINLDNANRIISDELINLKNNLLDELRGNNS